MAKVRGQNVPPSMVAPFAAVLKGGASNDGGYTVEGVNPKARSARGEEDLTETARFATATATWMVERWLKTADRGTRSRFYSARRAEVIRGNFDAEYWAECVALSDTSELCTPAVTPFDGAWNPTYWDEARQPTRCKYRDIARDYPTPEGEGTEENPTPGWEGGVVDSKWRDLYHVQRRIDFALPLDVAEGDGRPVAILLDWTIEANATVRGNKNWFTLIVHPIFRTQSWAPAKTKGACVRWAREDQYSMQIPGDEPGGWNYSVAHRYARDGRKFAEFYSAEHCNRLSVRIASPPSLGIYGSRNDAVAVRCSGTARAYVAK